MFKDELNILYVSHDSLSEGAGVSTYIKELMNYFRNSKTISFRNKSKNSNKKREYNLNYKTIFNEVIDISFNKFKFLIKSIKSADIIHDNPVSFYNLILLLIYKIYGKRVVSTLHSNIEFRNLKLNRLFEMVRYIFVINIYSILTDSIVLVTKSQREAIRKFIVFKKRLDKKSKVIHNFINHDQIIIKKKFNKRFRVIYVGRLTKNKGFHDLLKVINKLSDKEIEFYIVGDGILKKEIPLSNKVKHYSKIDNSKIKDFYDKCNVLVLPSYSETFGIVILEAMARGLPLVVSDLPAIREYIIEGINGYYFRPGDINKLATIILGLKNNPKKMLEMSKSNLEQIKSFTLNKSLKEYINIYHKAIK